MTAQSWERGDWMQTFTGRQFYPMAPAPEDVDVLDIAHALGLICRYGGHVSRFYSVAEHCVLLSHAVSPENALWALMHDATEAYVGDMVRPLKNHMRAYRAVEDVLMVTIAQRFQLPLVLGNVGVIPAEVQSADSRILLDERAAMMPATRYPWSVEQLAPLGVTVTGWQPAEAERLYLERFDDLMVERVAAGAS